MLKSNEEIFITVVASAFLMVLLAIVVVIAIVKYQNRMRKHTQEMETIKNTYQQEFSEPSWKCRNKPF
jgi:heme/copper-type cytochrome/quinol oxidase subunit 2